MAAGNKFLGLIPVRPTLKSGQQRFSPMLKNKWFILAVVGMGFGLMGMALLLILGVGFFAVHSEATGAAPGLPVYTLAQAPSAHAGYLRNTLTGGGNVFVNDYEE